VLLEANWEITRCVGSFFKLSPLEGNKSSDVFFRVFDIFSVHQYHTIYHKISSMECINHMPRTCANCVPTICLYQHSNHVPQTSVISLMICLYHEPSATTKYLNHQYINQTSQMYHPIHHVPKKLHQPFTKPQQNEPQSICVPIHVFPYMYSISTINLVPIILLASSSTNVLSMYQ
jgi:hypothetical protein